LLLANADRIAIHWKARWDAGLTSSVAPVSLHLRRASTCLSGRSMQGKGSSDEIERTLCVERSNSDHRKSGVCFIARPADAVIAN